MGLTYTSKHVALAASFVAVHADDPAVRRWLPAIMFAAVDAEDVSGNSLSYLNLILIALDAHTRLDPDPLQPDKHPELNDQLGQVAALSGLAAREGVRQLAAVDKILSELPSPLRDPLVQGRPTRAGSV